MHLPVAEFQECVRECQKLHEFFVLQVTSVLKDYAKKVSNPMDMPLSFTYFHQTVIDRLNSLVTFRVEHEKLSNAVSSVFCEGNEEDVRFEHEVDTSYSLFLEIDNLDSQTTGGKDRHSRTLKLYEQQISELEGQIVTFLRSLAGKCQSDEERSALLKRFNPLFYRKRIRSTIEALQTTMLQKIREDLERLREKFKVQFLMIFVHI